MSAKIGTGSAEEGKRSFGARLKSFNWLFFLFVVVPTTFSIVYYGVVASDVYVSESRFVVRSPQKQSVSGFGAFLQGAGFSRSQDDTYSIHDYILSRDALAILNKEMALGEAFGQSGIDAINRFAPFGSERSFESLHRYYLRRVQVDIDTTSSITTLKSSAFSAQAAKEINDRLLNLSEKLVNELNERGRQDTVRTAVKDVAEAERRAAASTLAVSNFRTQRGVFDPERQSALQLQLVSKLQDELISVDSQIAQVQMLSRENPQLPALRVRRSSLQKAIDDETQKVAGGTKSLSNRSAEYERLALERGFAEKQLGAALGALEQARGEAQRKQVYLERIVQPSLPDMATEPRRLRSIGATILLSFIAWGVAAMLLSGVREHKE